MRLAYFSPLNPARSGIADYSEELLPYLAPYAEIELVVDGYAPANAAITSRWNVIDDRAYDARRYDLALYHLGNSPAHAYIYRRALREPGVAVLHDLVLHHLVAWLTINHGDGASYVRAMREAYGDEGALLAARELEGRESLNRFDYPLSESVIRASRGVIAHSRYVVDAARRIAPAVPFAQINHELPPVELIPQSAARARLGLSAGASLVGSFGHIGPTKRTLVLLEAFAQVRRDVPGARLVLVGAPSPNVDVPAAVAQFGLADAVDLTGHVPFDEFVNYMAAMDVCVNLRYPTAGETSGAVLRMMAQARPVVVSRAGWFAELPGDAVVKIDVQGAPSSEREQLAAALRLLLRDANLRQALGARARAHVLRVCDPASAARRYAEFLEAVLARRAHEFPGLLPTESHDVGPEISLNVEATQAGSSRTSPPDDAPRDPPLDWRDDVAAQIAFLALDADDALLTAVATAAVELGLSTPRDESET
jgi:glycosyltransferase involved in cell wall biosynthesis